MQRLVTAAEERRWRDLDVGVREFQCKDIGRWSELLVDLSYYGGEPNWLKTVLKKGADPSFRNEIGDTALGQALDGSNRQRHTIRIFWHLLSAGADPNGLSRGGSRPLELAVDWNRPEYASMLLIKGADTDMCRLSGPSFQGWARDLIERFCRERAE